MASQQYRVVLQHWNLAIYKLRTGCMFAHNERKTNDFCRQNYGRSLVKCVIGCVLAVWIILSPTLQNIVKDQADTKKIGTNKNDDGLWKIHAECATVGNIAQKPMVGTGIRKQNSGVLVPTYGPVQTL